MHYEKKWRKTHLNSTDSFSRRLEQLGEDFADWLNNQEAGIVKLKVENALEEVRQFKREIKGKGRFLQHG